MKLPVCAVLLLGFAGLAPADEPSTLTCVTASLPNAGITYYRGSNGLAVLLVDDGLANSRSAGTSSTRVVSGGPPRSTWIGSGTLFLPDRTAYRWKLDMSDGEPVSFQLAGRDYDLDKGAVFVVRTAGGKAAVVQLKRDLSTLPAEAERCAAFVREDAEVLRHLRGERKKE